MSSHGELFKLGLLEVTLSPNPFTAGSFFNQTLDLSTATFSLYAGGTSLSDYAVLFTAWVDANSDGVLISVASRDPAATFSLAARVSSTRPAAQWNYRPAFGFCADISSQPDMYVDPLPPAIHLSRAAPLRGRAALRHAGGHRRPQRALPHLPSTVSFQPGSLIVYHRNVASDGDSLNMTLTQQGLAGLVSTTPDHWVDLQSGFALDGGAGPPLSRAGPAALASTAPAAAFQLRATVLAVQTDVESEWVADLAALVAASEVGTPAARAAHEAFWGAFWGRSYIAVNASAPGPDAAAVTNMYAVTRYTQAIQSRGTLWPIKFNGMAFIQAMSPGDGAADARDWGPSNWWQNTRLPYGAMLAAGDWEEFQVLLDYELNQHVLLTQRTQAYWGHPGMWTTETTHLSGAYDMSDYGCSRDPAMPTWLMASGYLHVDQGGDSGTGEWPLMALDYLSWTGDASRAAPYLPLAFSAADYFMFHFNKSADGKKIVVFPAQVLETFWCDWQKGVGFTNCCEDDAPTISGMVTLFEKLLQLPVPALATQAQHDAWAAFVPLIPDLPLTPDGSSIAPARVLSSGKHNSEGPELYAMHPHRVFTRGREVATGANITLGRSTVANTGWARNNGGWNYGINGASPRPPRAPPRAPCPRARTLTRAHTHFPAAYALIGAAPLAAAQLLQRAHTGPAAGYRWPGFAPHEQDFDPSADHFANMNRALQEMLIQSGEDGLDATVVLFPAWPCSWDVQFKLHGPGNTTVEVEYAAGKLVSLAVDPPARASAVKWASCVPA
jgi:hypothetical protein